ASLPPAALIERCELLCLYGRVYAGGVPAARHLPLRSNPERAAGRSDDEQLVRAQDYIRRLVVCHARPHARYVDRCIDLRLRGCDLRRAFHFAARFLRDLLRRHLLSGVGAALLAAGPIGSFGTRRLARWGLFF